MSSARPPLSKKALETTSASLDKLTSELSTLCKKPLLNAREQVAMRAMVAYAAYDQGVREEVVWGFLQRKFGFKDAAQVTREAYEIVMHYLVDLDVRQSAD